MHSMEPEDPDANQGIYDLGMVYTEQNIFKKIILFRYFAFITIFQSPDI